MKSQKVTTVTTKELDLEELKNKEEELAHKNGTLDHNNATIKAMQTKLDMDLMGIHLKNHLAKVVAANPLGFEKSEAYGDYLKRKMAFDLKTHKFMEGQLKSNFLRQKGTFDLQNGRCSEDILRLEKRIKELKRNIALYADN